ncbi:MAG TPA: amidohydrolase [Vicinamibacterales bacterium]|jgi:aminobenzoyl-glutamate utilization protein B
MKKLLLPLVLVTLSIQPSAQSDPKVVAIAWVDSNIATLNRVNRNIWGWAETGLEEVKSSQELQDLLRANGFTVESGVAGMPTAFTATFGAGAPVIGILAEFDALPGLSQEASAERKSRPEVMAGHGCGHSVFGTASTGAAIAIKQALAAGAIKGTVKLFGTPAEETGIGKTYMLREGVFKGVDTILAWHAGDRTAAAWDYSKAMVSVKFKFEGLPSHASVSPERGRSALDAVELMSVGVNYMREHVKEDTRIHYVITNGGGQPNVVPPSAEVWYYLRANKHTDVEDYFVWLQEIARAAAAMSRTKLIETRVDADMHEVLPNRTLVEMIQKNLELIGPPAFDEREKAFARATQKDLKPVPELALAERVEPLPAGKPEQGTHSTDVGDLTWFFPVGQFTAATYSYGAPGHSWQIAACTGMSIGEKGMAVAAKTIAATAIDLYRTPAALERARADQRQMMSGQKYSTLIPEGQKAPKSIR